MIWHVLRGKINLFHLLAFLFANGLGLAVVLISLQAYGDLTHIMGDKETFADQGFLTISKKVSLFKTLRNKRTHFSEEEIEELRQHPSISAVGAYLPADFKVQALAYDPSSSGALLKSDLFFEAVPNEFLDITPRDWDWQEGDSLVPIIVPRSYLQLYNFGFAVSQNLPQLSDNMISRVKFDLRIYGNRQRARYQGKIVGFSQQLNSILVPHAFLAFANRQYGSSGSTPASMRLLLKPVDPTDSRLSAFLSQKDYDLDPSRLQNQRIHFFLQLATGGMIAIGLLICALALGLFLMSFFLLFERNKQDLQLLFWLGHPLTKLYRPFGVMLFALGNLALTLGWVGMETVRSYWLNLISAQLPDFESAGSMHTVVWVVLGINVVLVLAAGLMRRRFFRMLVG